MFRTWVCVDEDLCQCDSAWTGDACDRPADSDGDVNLKDFSQFALYWLDVACGGCSGADLTCDGDVNADDLKELACNWLW